MQQKQLLTILKKSTEALSQLLGPKLQRIVLYGSRARGDFTLDSDVDILIMTNISQKETQKYRKRISKIFTSLSLEHDIILSFALVDEASYNFWLQAIPFYQNVEKEGIILYDKNKYKL